MLGRNDLPFGVAGERVLILEKPPKEKSEGGIFLPDVAKMVYFSGKLIDAGLQARDKLYDNGYEIGDDVEFGKYMGLREAWDHVIEGDHTLPDEAYKWRQHSTVGGHDFHRLYKCENTGAIRAIESVIILNCDDLIASVQLADRIRRGALVLKRDVTADGATCHHFERRAVPDPFAIAEAEHRRAMSGLALVPDTADMTEPPTPGAVADMTHPHTNGAA